MVEIDNREEEENIDSADGIEKADTRSLDIYEKEVESDLKNEETELQDVDVAMKGDAIEDVNRYRNEESNEIL